MVLALAALAAAAASFPTGFGFGAGYGAGVRIGYDVIYPKLAPFAAKITDDIIGQVGKLFGGDAGQIATQSGAPSGFAFSSQRTNKPVAAPTASASDVATLDPNVGASVARTRQPEEITTSFSLAQIKAFNTMKHWEFQVTKLTARVAQGGEFRQANSDFLAAAKINLLKAIGVLKSNGWFTEYADWRKQNG